MEEKRKLLKNFTDTMFEFNKNHIFSFSTVNKSLTYIKDLPKLGNL